MNDLLKCGIPNKNIKVLDLHTGMEIAELQKYDVVYLCGGDTTYLLERVNATGFSTTLMEYIKQDGMVIGVSAGSLLFSNNLVGNLGLINTRLDVHCPDGEVRGKIEYPLKDNIRLTNTCALVIREFPDENAVLQEWLERKKISFVYEDELSNVFYERDMLNCILNAFDSVQDVYFMLKEALQM